MLRPVASLVNAGLRPAVLLAPSDGAAPASDPALAAHVAALGAPVFAATPDQFPALVAAALEGRDVGAWAEGEGIPVTRAPGQTPAHGGPSRRTSVRRPRPAAMREAKGGATSR